MLTLAEALTPLEMAAGWASGHEPLPVAPGPHLPPEQALESALLGALRRPPCVVPFSGGRDSTLLLGAALSAARRHSLPAPIAMTLRFPDAPAAREDHWQELAIAHLRPADWERIEPGAEVEHLGPISRDLLRRHGPFMPPNAQLMVPMLERARGGSLVSGFGGDEALDPGPWQRAVDVLARRRPPTRADVPRLALHRAPVGLRTSFLARAGRTQERSPWLRPQARRTMRRAAARDVAAEPADWRRALPYRAGSRTLTLSRQTLQRIASEHDCEVSLPFLDPLLLGALGAWGGRVGPASRAEALMRAFPAAMPGAVAHRRDKAGFSAVSWGGASRRFAAEWDGTGIDHDLTDPVALRQAWLDGRWHAAGLPLQIAWCARAHAGTVSSSSTKEAT